MFNFEDYKGNYVMNCKTQEEADEFCALMDKNGKHWCSGDKYTNDTNWSCYGGETCYRFNCGDYCSVQYFKENGYTILCWSDFSETSIVKNMTTEEKIRYYLSDFKNIAINTKLNNINSELEEIRDSMGKYDSLKERYTKSVMATKKIIKDYIETSHTFETITKIATTNEIDVDNFNVSEVLGVLNDLDFYNRNINIYRKSMNELSNLKLNMKHWKEDEERFIETIKDLESKKTITYIDKLVEDFKNLENNKFVKSIEVSKYNVGVKTNEIYCNFTYDDNDYKARLGEYEISIPYDRNSEIRIFNINENDKRKSYWSDKDNHPHVSDCGHACFGNTSAFIAQGYDDDSFYEIFLAVLGFLQQADTTDPAGRCVVNWDCFDMDGNPVNKEDFTITCACCGCILDPSEDEIYYCEDCGRPMCEDCGTYIENYGTVCNNCLDDNYEYCEECCNYTSVDDMYEVDGNRMCYNCYQYHLDNCQIYMCVNCGEAHYDNNMMIDKYGDTYCQECYEGLDEEDKKRLFEEEE